MSEPSIESPSSFRESPDATEVYRRAFETATDAIMLLDKDGVLDCNAAALRMFGVSDTHDLLARDPGELSPDLQPDGEDSRVAAAKRIREAHRYGSAQFSWVHRRAHGEEFPVEVTLTSFEKNGREYLQATLRDETARRLFEETLWRRDVLLEAVAFTSSRLLSAADVEKAITAALAHLGKAIDVSRVYICENYTDADDDLKMSQRYEWCAERSEPQADNPKLFGQSYARAGFMRWRVRLSRGRPLYGLVRDFPQAERSALSEQDIQSLLVVPISTPQGWWGFMGFDECRGERDWSPGEVEILRTAAAAVGAAITRARSEDDLRQVNRELERHVAKRTLALQEEVIERGRTEEARLRLATAVEHAAEAIMVAAPDATIRYVNPAFERITGYGASEVIGRKPSILKSGEHDEAFYRDLWQTISSGRSWSGRIVNRRADGSRFLVDGTISPIPDGDGGIAGYVSVKRDVTREAELESQLRQAQKIEAIGTLASGIAHDFNNILSAVLGFSELAILDIDPKSEAHMCVRQVVKAGRRATELIRQILTFSRETEQARRAIRLQAVCKESAKLLRGTLPSTIDIEFSVDETCGPVMADPTQIYQAIMNLCTNAYHAMRDSGGGQLLVTYRQESVSGAQAAARLELEAGDYACLSVTDTGTGMDEETRKRVFEPYFTTKKASEGTGLGLASTHGIVRSHGGAIAVESSVGKGTTFRIYLPISCAPVESDPADEPEADPGFGSERVLFVDDEDAIVDLGKRALSRMGYQVTTFTSSTDALAEVEARSDGYDIVVTDLTMPRLPGLALAAKIHAVRPDLPVILCTGFADRVAQEDLDQASVRALLPKPIVPRDMARAIRHILDTPGS